MATTLYVQSATAGNPGTGNSLAQYVNPPGASLVGFYGFQGGGVAQTITGTLPYNGQPFIRYQSATGVGNGTTVVDVVFPSGNVNNASNSYALVYTVAGGVLT